MYRNILDVSIDQSSPAIGEYLSLRWPQVLILCLTKFHCNNAPFILRVVTVLDYTFMTTLSKP